MSNDIKTPCRVPVEAESVYSTIQVCRIVGLTYRQLDWWLRTGKIELTSDATPGSGNNRLWTPEEVRRLKHVVAVYHEARETMAALRSGDLWARSG
jgi:hypothetical protein